MNEEIVWKAYEDHHKNGLKYKEIAEKYGVSLSAVKSWASRYWKKTGCNLENEKVATKVATRKRGAQLGNKNATGPPGNKNAAGNRGGSAPDQNKNAEKYGFFSKYLPDETKEIFDAVAQADPLDLLWHQIQIAYAAIVRAQKIAYVKDQQDKTIERIEKKDGEDFYGEKWEVQQAWDKQNNFLKAQARAQAELRNMIKQYDEMLHKNWELASEEQKSRIAQMKAQTAKLAQDPNNDTEDGVEIINDAPKETG